MEQRIRILIADTNRYHSLLLEREIHRRFETGVTATFRTNREALAELKRNKYDAAVIDCSLAFECETNLYRAIREETEQLPIVLTGAPGVIQPETRSAKNERTAFVTKEGTSHILIPQLIEHFLKEGTFFQNGRALRPRLSVRRKADMINITAKTLAHEINNPLMTILGMTELLLNDGNGNDAETRSKIEVIRESAKRIGSVLEHLGTLSSPTLRTTVVGNLIDTNPPEASVRPQK